MKLGAPTTTSRGFQLVKFKDCYGVPCSLQASSLAKHAEPGTSAIWIGPEEPNPRIMWSNAANHNIQTAVTEGWVPFHLPSGVVCDTRAHLDRNQVRALIHHLQSWLNCGKF